MSDRRFVHVQIKLMALEALQGEECKRTACAQKFITLQHIKYHS